LWIGRGQARSYKRRTFLKNGLLLAGVAANGNGVMKNQELNLLHIFNAIMVERSITRAAERLGMTQPAVSNAVSRMRSVWNDPLFVKKGRAIAPTAFALSLWNQVRGPIDELAAAVDVQAFEAASSTRTFRVAVTDLILEMVWQPLVCALQRNAPGINLHAVSFSPSTAVEQLREASVDLLVGIIDEQDHSLRSHSLFSTGYVLAMRSGHPLAETEIALEQFLRARHLLATMSGDAHGVVDDALSVLGEERRIAVTVNHFSAVPELLRHSDLIAAIPEVITSDCAFREGITIAELPLSVPETAIHLAWHRRHDRDEGIAWMRQQIESIATACWQQAMAARGRDCSQHG
tara:strand:+ start:25629 stop:26672 length:1044 start_codon:yes stop_codon:yes gene_type:complete